MPGVAWYPIVDPRGLVTPGYDGWSLDFWFVPEDGTVLASSKSGEFSQSLKLHDNLSIDSLATWPAASIETNVQLRLEADEPVCCVSVRAPTGRGFVAVVLRPYNPEGISFVHKIALAEDRKEWAVNGRASVQFDRAPARHALSVYRDGDVSHRLHDESTVTEASCDVGLASAAALFPSDELRESPLELRIPIYDELNPDRRPRCTSTQTWSDANANLAKLRVGDARTQTLFDAAVSTLVLLTPEDVFPGPYTYKRFWFRDAAFVLNALLSLGGINRTRHALRLFAPRQRSDGYFLSQEGEWDSNGAAMWIYHRFARLTGETLPADWLKAVRQGAGAGLKSRLSSIVVAIFFHGNVLLMLSKVQGIEALLFVS
jgi:hypothetical protein